MAAPVIEVQNVTKRFAVARPLHEYLLAPFGTRESVTALKEISFSTKGGEVLGVVGPNGAGKTTLLRILADLLEADSGTVKLWGEQLGKGRHSLRGRIGYVSSDERSFFWRLTGRENLDFFSRLYGVGRSESKERLEEMLEAFGLKEKAMQLFRDYSTGTRKKFALIRALIHRPGVILLDEVTNSLDPASTRSVKSFVREYLAGHAGRAAVWSTHRLEEVTEVCDRALVIERGTIRFDGSASDFKNKQMVQSGRSSGTITSGEGGRVSERPRCEVMTVE